MMEKVAQCSLSAAMPSPAAATHCLTQVPEPSGSHLAEVSLQRAEEELIP